MFKIIISILFLFTNTSNSEYKIKINKGVGELKLGQKFDGNPYNSDELHIQKENGYIISFQIKSEKFKTSKGISIGDSINYISRVYRQKTIKSYLKNNNRTISTFGEGVILKRTAFMDLDGDQICDHIFIALNKE